MEVRVNAAMSADGKLSTVRREQVAISGPADFDRVDALRAEWDAVMVGIGTVLADDPHLTVKDRDRVATREANGRSPQPARVVADTRARLPPDASVLDDAAPTYVLVGESAPRDRVATLESTGADIVQAGSDRVDLPVALGRLEADGIDRLLVEGGGELLYSLFEAELVDDVSLYVGNLIIGGRDAPTLADGPGFVESFPTLRLNGIDRLDDGVVLSWSVSGSDRSPPRT